MISWTQMRTQLNVDEKPTAAGGEGAAHKLSIYSELQDRKT
jgi:hypothetical protein